MRRFAAPLLCLLAASACVHDPYGSGYGPGYGYAGDEWSGHDMDELFRLDPWPKGNRRGRGDAGRSLGGAAVCRGAGEGGAGHGRDAVFGLDAWLKDAREGQGIVGRSLGEAYHPEA